MKNKIEFQNWYNYDPANHPGETNTEVDMCIPDESYTPKELLENFVKGIPMPANGMDFYSNTDDFDDVDETLAPDFDLADAHRLSQEIADRRIKAYQQKMADKAAGSEDQVEQSDGERSAAKAKPSDV